MTPIAILFLVLAVVIIGGGLLGSILFLAGRSEIEKYPEGGTDGVADLLE